jgi:hypothetical protein
MAITIPLDSYCAVTDVSALTQQQTISSGSKPTEAQVETWITMYFHRINGMLRRAGYHVPMVTTRQQLIVGTQLQLNKAHNATDDALNMKDSGGSLTGSVMEGDAFTIAGDSQIYVATDRALSSSNLITVYISPTLRKAAAEDANVTYTPLYTAKEILKQLNSLPVAALVMQAVFSSGSNKSNVLAGEYREMYDDLYKKIRSGETYLAGARRSRTTAPIGSARMERRG